MRFTRFMVLGMTLVSTSVVWAQEPVFVTLGSYPSVSPNGSWLAFKISGHGIGVMPTAGGPVDTLTSAGNEVDWAPSGDLVVVRNGNDLYTIDVTTESATLLRSDGFDDGPAWSPLGDEIALQGSSGVVFVAFPSGALSPMPSCVDPIDVGCEGEGPTWSPDGEWIAFEDGRDILKVRRSGGDALALVGGEPDVTTAAWSPDGEWIAFAMGDVSNPFIANIWVMSADGFSNGAAQLTFTARSSFRPSWSNDSRTIFFESTAVSDPLEVPEIWRVDFDPSDIVSVTSETWSHVKERFREDD